MQSSSFHWSWPLGGGQHWDDCSGGNDNATSSALCHLDLRRCLAGISNVFSKSSSPENLSRSCLMFRRSNVPSDKSPGNAPRQRSASSYTYPKFEYPVSEHESCKSGDQSVVVQSYYMAIRAKILFYCFLAETFYGFMAKAAFRDPTTAKQMTGDTA